MLGFNVIDVGNVRLRVALDGAGPLVVMVHGFPESWYSWRHQIGPIAEAGFAACAIDVRGYGGSDKPHPVDRYAMEHMTADLAGLIEKLSPERPAVLVGHDWGAPIVWNTALIHPERVRAVCALSVPYTGVPTRSFDDIFHEAFTSKGRFFYQAYFQDEGAAEAEAEENPRDFLRKFYYAICGDAPDGAWPNDKTSEDTLLKGLIDPNPFPAWLTEEELDYYVGEFEGSGFRGPINRYRNHRRDFEYLQTFKDRRIRQPALFIGGSKDPVLSMMGRVDLISLMREQVRDLRGAHVLEGCGHWTQQERPEEVNRLLVEWLKGL
ncbi:MAG: alpha/beta hydrolase [Proteobacteria bacterium]|nr:alpha/beta hydrolase [Pseudomonadota bacterium]